MDNSNQDYDMNHFNPETLGPTVGYRSHINVVGFKYIELIGHLQE